MRFPTEPALAAGLWVSGPGTEPHVDGPGLWQGAARVCQFACLYRRPMCIMSMREVHRGTSFQALSYAPWHVSLV